MINGSEVRASPSPTSIDDARKAQLVFAFQRIFRVLAPILVREQVPYFEFRDILRYEFIAAALRDGVPGWLDDPEGKTSIAAQALRLGVPEAEIRRLVYEPEILAPPKRTNTDVMAAVLTIWSTNTEFHGPYGLPLQLALVSSKGPSFTDLVHRVNPALDAVEIMEDMLFFGMVARVGSSLLSMTGRELFISRAEKGNIYELLGNGIEHLADTITKNLYSEKENKLFHRQVVSDRPIPVSKLDEFRELIRGTYTNTLGQIDDWLVAAAEESAASNEESVMVGVVIHEFHRHGNAQVVPFVDLVHKEPSAKPAWEMPTGIRKRQ